MTQEVKLRRAQCSYQAENARFLLECDFSKQYSHYYRRRLEKTLPFLEFNCRSKWDPNLPLYSLVELASITCDNWDHEEQVGISPVGSVSPPDGSSFRLSKRIRRFSQNASPFPRSSTQNERDNVKPKIEQTPDVALSPIEKTASSELTFKQEKDAGETLMEPPNCIVIGTIFKRMKLQPDVVRELTKGDFHIKCDRYLGCYTSQDDKLVLEDADESISLVGNIDPNKLVTGVVVGLKGFPINDGAQFMVRDICYAEPNRQILYDIFTTESQEIASIDKTVALKQDSEPIYLMVLSELGFHPDMAKQSVLTRALQNLINFTWGGSEYTNDDRSSRVARILVIGSSLSESRFLLDDVGSSQKDPSTKLKESRQVKAYEGSVQAIKNMDDFFAQLSKTIDVDVMPGPTDPTSHLLPQQPFHPCMFPKSCMFATFNCTTNPHRAIYNDNVEVLATSGQNVDIISKFSGIKDSIEIMKWHLSWGNSAPNAPDNLYSVPYEEDDPHVIDFIPEIYVAGSQDSYRTDYFYCKQSNVSASDVEDTETNIKIENTVVSTSQESRDRSLAERENPAIPIGKKDCTLLITVPKFCETYTCVLINLKNLESHTIVFN